MSRHHKPRRPHSLPFPFLRPKPHPHKPPHHPHHPTQMHSLLHQSHKSLRQFLHPTLDIIKQIPISLLKSAKGIIFLSVVQGGFIIGGEGGSGILLVRKSHGNNPKWSNPIAIGIGGIKFGLQIGVSKVNYIMILTSDNCVKTFLSDGQLKFGGDLNISTGPVGRDTDFSIVGSSKSVSTVYSYSMSKGAYLGVTLKAEIIATRNDCNARFYGKKVSTNDIINNKLSMKPNDDYYKICNLLNMHCQKQNLVNYSPINADNSKEPGKTTDINKNEPGKTIVKSKDVENKDDNLSDMEIESDVDDDPANEGKVTI